MGVKGLTKLLADNAPKAVKVRSFQSYFGRKIAIDASMSIYQFLVVVGRSGTEMLTNEAGEVTSHLQGMFTRTVRLLEAGMEPVYVFDGKPPDLKQQELAKRYSKRAEAYEDLSEAIESGNREDIEKFSKRTVKVTKQHSEGCKRLLSLMGVPVIEAPSEAEAQCAALCKSGKVYAVASEDMDSLTFGAPRFLRHLMVPSSKKVPVMEFEVAKILEELNLTMDQFIDLCILSGCDYCGSIRGVGGKTALKLIHQYSCIENILKNINKERYQIPDDWPYQEVRQLFKEPTVLAEERQLDLKWTAPDEEGLVTFLVNENGFNRERVTKAMEIIKATKNKSSQGQPESVFKPMANCSTPIKRKVRFLFKFMIFYLHRIVGEYIDVKFSCGRLSQEKKGSWGGITTQGSGFKIVILFSVDVDLSEDKPMIVMRHRGSKCMLRSFKPATKRKVLSPQLYNWSRPMVIGNLGIASADFKLSVMM